jgi:hypothetical protein
VTVEIEGLVRGFEAGTAPAGGFHHTQHVQVAWHYLCHHALPAALDRFSTGLKRFALAQGAPGLYHETITVAYVLLINERLARTTAPDWATFAAEHADLLVWKPSVLERYYTPALLASERAKRTFMMPDRLRGDGTATSADAA